MKRFKILIIIFCLALAAPLSYFVIQTLHGLEQEEIAELNFFAATLFDNMEEELASLVLREENRSIEEYSPIALPDLDGDKGKTNTSTLVNPPPEKYILGYFQNSPDGSFQTPLQSADLSKQSKEMGETVDRLTAINRVLNLKRTPVAEKRKSPKTVLKENIQAPQKQELALASRYLDTRTQKKKASLGQARKRYEEITLAQARNIAGNDIKPQGLAANVTEKRGESAADSITPTPTRARSMQEETLALVDRNATWEEKVTTPDRQKIKSGRPYTSSSQESSAKLDFETFSPRPQLVAESEEDSEKWSAGKTTRSIQVEVAPLQSMMIDNNHIFIFRRIELNKQIYRQGFVITIKPFLEYLQNSFFKNQPMASFTNLNLSTYSSEKETASLSGGITVPAPVFELQRSFPRPFSFLQATLTCQEIPRTTGRQTLLIMLSVLSGIMLLGLFAIYQSARVVVDLSERRSGFVSSVTHELKTPLTNIRMYIEMLEQGIAGDRNREEDYYRILDSETSRLSRLINNVLEFSNLERKQRPLALQQGNFEEVINEVAEIMNEKIRQEKFVLKIEKDAVAPFIYDREVMVQILINLIENSIKFGREQEQKEITLSLKQRGNKTEIAVADTGPGIPDDSLKKIFNDFYRVDNSLTRSTKGTGIGLALVKKFITATGGTVKAINNKGPGCTITLGLPQS